VITRTLYRPVGAAELKLIENSGFSAFPPRLPEQPIFYPVLVEEYAIQIAQDWNTKDGQTGYVTEFDVSADYLDQYQEHTVGARGLHVELWVPAEDLDQFNEHIVGSIRITRAFRGDPPREIPLSP